MPVVIEDEQFDEFQECQAGYCVECKVFVINRPLARGSARKCASCGAMTEIAFLDAYDQGEFHKRSDGIEEITEQDEDDEVEDDEDDDDAEDDDDDVLED